MSHSPVHSTIHALGRNLAAGLRLALFMPVERASFRISAAQLILVVLLSAAIDVDAGRSEDQVASDVLATVWSRLP